MAIMDKLETLVAAAQFDSCGYSSARSVVPASPRSPERFIYRAALPGGGTVCLLKVLLTNICINDCGYCVNQIGRDVPRCSFQPEELARLFMEMYQKKLVQGLFLSSGIGKDASQTMQSMIKVVEILRHKCQFKGYIHLKILPGASFDCIEAGSKLANRVSVNMEAPTVRHLAKLSLKKNLYDGILERMRWVKSLTDKDVTIAPSGQTTQFVVGAAGETDRDILHASEALYSEVGLRRAYFSAFHPLRDSRLEEVLPTPPIREHRLYQVDWLFRVYGFSPREIEQTLNKEGNLSLTKDPKLTIAQKQPWLFPVDINNATYQELLRVPGIGPTSAGRIIEARRERRIFSVQQLKKMGVVTGRAVTYIWFKGMLDFEKQTPIIPDLGELSVPSLSQACR